MVWKQAQALILSHTHCELCTHFPIRTVDSFCRGGSRPRPPTHALVSCILKTRDADAVYDSAGLDSLLQWTLDSGLEEPRPSPLTGHETPGFLRFISFMFTLALNPLTLLWGSKQLTTV